MPSERFLVWRLRRGDGEACRELIRRHHAGVYGYLRRLGARSTLAEDLTQETYAKAWQGIRTLRKSASLRSWLLTIARNEYLQWVRAEGRAMAPDDRPETPDEVTPDPRDGVLIAERDRRLRQAIERLDPPLREAVALHYFQDLSLREAGEVLDIPAGTVKSRIHRALARLRALLDQEEADHGRQRAGQAAADRS